MTHHDPVPKLEELGFTDRQARFLSIAARHSGYFARRHYTEWAEIPRTSGANPGFLMKLVARRFARPFRLRETRGYWYHLSARRLYEAIGDPSNPNQKRLYDTPLALLERIRILDFVIAHRDCEFFPTYRDKLALVRDYGIPDDRLPMRSFGNHGARTRSHTPQIAHYLSERPPLVRRPGSSAVYIPYVWAERTKKPFQTFMERYLPLLDALPRAGVVLVLPPNRENYAAICARIFHRTIRVGILRYFRDRAAWEHGDYAAFPAERVWQLRQDEARYAGERYQSLYRRWQIDGDTVLSASHAADNTAAQLPTFEVYVLQHTYEQFGPWAAY